MNFQLLFIPFRVLVEKKHWLFIVVPFNDWPNNLVKYNDYSKIYFVYTKKNWNVLVLETSWFLLHFKCLFFFLSFCSLYLHIYSIHPDLLTASWLLQCSAHQARCVLTHPAVARSDSGGGHQGWTRWRLKHLRQQLPSAAGCSHPQRRLGHRPCIFSSPYC